ncbi:MAG: outer membrane beta-barrel protein [Mucilaginibacter sp.]|nr:outer membrane beta-barrel protein [Mucilaginibacter sp.]
MKRTYLLCLIFLVFSTSLFAQNKYTLKGVVSDSVEHVKLRNASVSVLNAKDSTLVTFARTAEDGSFNINNLHPGKFIVLLSYPDYADYVDKFSLDSAKQDFNFGNLHMELKSRLLHEVIIKGSAAQMKIKGDTTEFNAAAYVTQPNAKVEDLLKQLPGIQVDKDGKITAQGQQVNKVLVDGEEFFGDDPTLVTKNIRADMVDKVQLYDKKSDQAAFTGIDDGKKEKTLNIKLKADKKNGMFGKAEAGDGTENIYQAQVLFNAFKAKQKFSVYGTLGNNGKTGLGWDDNQKYGSGSNMQSDDSGMVFFFGGSGDDLDSFNGRYNGQGLPIARTGGAHYDTKWNDDKQSLNTNYKIGSLTVDGSNTNITQNNLPDTIINSTSTQKYHNYMFRQKLDATYNVKLDTSSNLKIAVDGTSKHTNTVENFIASELRNDTLINSSNRNLTNNVDQKLFNASAFYTHKFKKPRRTLSFNIAEAFNQSEAKGFLKSEVDFYNPQKLVDSTSKIDQYKTNNLKSSTLTTNLTYTEPLSKSLAIVFNYGVGINDASADRRSFDGSSNYKVLNDTFSSNYKLNSISNQGGAIFNYKKGKTIINFGAKVADVNLDQTDEYTGRELKRDFINWMPQANFQYRFSQQKSFNVGYSGRTTLPTIDQLQPIRNNNDNLHIIEGNPDLKPSFANNFNVWYNSFKVVSSQYIYLSANYSYTSNPIVSDITYAPNGGSISKYFNLQGKQNSNFSIWANFDKKIEKLDMNAGAGVTAFGNTFYNMVNGVLNRTESYNFNPRVNFGKYKEKKFDFYLSGGPTYTISKSSLQPNINNNGAGINADGGFNIYLPGKFQIGSNSSYQYTAKTQSFNTDFSKVLINASIVKTFLKNDNLKFTIWGNDLLNQNVGFSRTVNSNMIVQNSYTTLKRYIMFTIDYEFTKMAGGAAKK